MKEKMVVMYRGRRARRLGTDPLPWGYLPNAVVVINDGQLESFATDTEEPVSGELLVLIRKDYGTWHITNKEKRI